MPVHVIFQHQQIVSSRQFEQAAAAVERHASAGGILIGGRQIEQLGPMPGYEIRQRIEAQALFITRHRINLDAGTRQQIEYVHVGWLFDQDGIARTQHGAQDEGQALFGATGHQQLVWLHLDAESGQFSDNGSVQRRIALDKAVLQHGGAIAAQHRVQGQAIIIDRQQISGRHAGRKGEDIRSPGQPHHLAIEIVRRPVAGIAQTGRSHRCAGQGRHPIEYKAAPPHMRIDVAFSRQFSISGYHCHAIDAQTPGQLSRRRQPGRRRQLPALDCCNDRLLNLLVERAIDLAVEGYVKRFGNRHG